MENKKIYFLNTTLLGFTDDENFIEEFNIIKENKDLLVFYDDKQGEIKIHKNNIDKNDGNYFTKKGLNKVIEFMRGKILSQLLRIEKEYLKYKNKNERNKF